MDDTIHNTGSVGSQSAVDAGSSLSCGAGKICICCTCNQLCFPLSWRLTSATNRLSAALEYPPIAVSVVDRAVLPLKL